MASPLRARGVIPSTVRGAAGHTARGTTVGGVTFFQTITGTLNASGSLVKKTSIFPAGILTTSGSLLKTISIYPSGVLSFTSSIIKKISIFPTGIITFSGSLTKTSKKLLTGNINFSGGILKTISITLSGNLSLSGNLTKQTSKVLTGTIVFSGSVIKQISKALSGILTFSGLILKTISVFPKGTITFSGSLIKLTQKILMGSITFTGFLIKQISKGTIGELVFSGSLFKKTQKLLTGSISFSGTLIALIPEGLQIILTFFSGRLTTIVKSANLSMIYRISRQDVDQFSGKIIARTRSGRQNINTNKVSEGLTMQWFSGWLRSRFTPLSGFQMLGLGERLDYAPDGQSILYDRKDPADNTYYDIYTMTPAGNHLRDITPNAPGLPTNHIGNPDWHSDGQHFVFQAAKQTHSCGIGLSAPGIGAANDIWIGKIVGLQTTYTKIYNTPAGRAVLHPHFNRAGTHLVWSEQINGPACAGGNWGIKYAPVSLTPTPVLGAIVLYQPNGSTGNIFYEVHSFDPTDRYLLYTAGYDTDTWEIYRFDFVTDTFINLSNLPGQWNEHAHYSPDGNWIIFTSSYKVRGSVPSSPLTVRLDLYMMKADGSSLFRLTHFNEPGWPEFVGPSIIGEFDWAPNGRNIITKVDNFSTRRLCRLDLKSAYWGA